VDFVFVGARMALWWAGAGAGGETDAAGGDEIIARLFAQMVCAPDKNAGCV